MRPELSAKWMLSELPLTRKTGKNVYFSILQIFEWYNWPKHCQVPHPVQYSLWLKRNRASVNKSKFYSILMWRIWIYSKKSISYWTSEFWCIWHIFGKLGFFTLFLSAPLQAASDYMPAQFFKYWLLPVLKCLKRIEVF